jgi:hypothetical protein
MQGLLHHGSLPPLPPAYLTVITFAYGLSYGSSSVVLTASTG